MYCIGKVIRHLFATVASTDTKMRFLILAICLHVSLLLLANLLLSYLRGNVTENVICPDCASECPIGYACCELQPERYGYCPLENAVCCPDNRTQCSSGNTCCRLSRGGWGCCPLANAVCCNDLPCCQEGYTYGPGNCQEDSLSVSLSKKSSSISKNTTCEDKQSVYTDSDTCCEGSNNSSMYACCLDKEGVCCSDGKSCCPKGYICKVRDKTSDNFGQSLITCEKMCKHKGICCLISFPIDYYFCCIIPNAKCISSPPFCVSKNPMFKKLPSMLTADVKVICPDGGQCDDNATCCPISTSGYGCCPQPNAVCCSDHTHCCPEGYTCQTSGSCVLENSVIAMTQNFPAVADQSDIICSGQSRFVVNSTCSMVGKEYACNSLQDAVCCDDQLTCCSQDYNCNTNTATCDRDNTALPSIEHQPLHLPPSLKWTSHNRR